MSTINLSEAREYAQALLAEDSEDAFHSLIEGGEVAVAAVSELLQTPLDEEQYKRLVDVLADVRLDAARCELVRLLESDFCPRWTRAAEALWYNDSNAAAHLLQHLIARCRPSEQALKRTFLFEQLL